MTDKLRMRELSEKLLGRESGGVVDGESLACYKGKTVLVTGGGGSIGSELCRRLCRCFVGKLVIFDIYENCAFELLDELSASFGNIPVFVEIGSVADKACVERLFQKYDFDTVFHAAAHKHVPLMEECCAEAVKNNIFGTRIIFEAAEKAGCERVILISTDKAVNPVSVMGATKRFCEMMAEVKRDGKTVFSSVRFGNVLGSAGSLLPLLAGRIERGEAVSITDKRMTRYFMTPSEAAELVLLAGAVGVGGEIFVLDMGEPRNIYELCLRLVRLLGKEPFSDVMIEETGARPGEKLSEELFLGKVSPLAEKPRIFVQQSEPFSKEDVEARLRILKAAVQDGSNEAVKAALSQTVPGYAVNKVL